jgi:N-acetylglucosamine-6-phosphate deacetylase
MLRTIITGGTILTPYQRLSGHSLIFERDKIIDILPDLSPIEEVGGKVFDASGLWVTPGLIDIHTHGADGYDTMDATPEALQGYSQFLAQQGVTSFLPTTVAASKEDIQSAIDTVAQMIASVDGARLLGIHLEGPYLNAAHKGAQPQEQLRKAQKAEYHPWITHDLVKLFTVAPEIEGVMDLISEGQDHGVEFAVGHSGASYEVMQDAVNRGLRQATHTFNGMLGLHHRRPGTVGSVLTEERIYAQVIADGVHLHPAIVKLIIKAKGVERTILISDSIRATGLKDGEYTLGEQAIYVNEGIARISSGSLAGSTLTMDTAVRNTMKFTSLSFPEVLPMATSVPSKAMGLDDQIGILKPGARADIVCFNAMLNIRKVFIGGELVVEK